MKIKERAKSLRENLGTIYLVLKDRRTPWIAKILAGITIVYALSPVDIIPDFIPILGYIDDLILLPLFIVLTIKCIPNDLYEEKRKLAIHIWEDGLSKKWYFALPIIGIWMVVLTLLIKCIWF